MDKLKGIITKIREKVSGLKKSMKIALIIGIAAVLIGLISLIFISRSNKYAVLFSNLPAKDSQTIISKLTDQKVDYKVDGNTIYVAKDKASELKLKLSPELSGGSVGYELMDSQSSFGMTDEEFKIKKQRMLEGEIEKTIKSFSNVDSAIVHITPSQDSVFVKDSQPGKASVAIKIKAGATLSKDQVKSIVALVSASTENIPKENVQVVDDKMNLLSQNLYSENGENADSQTVEKQKTLESNYESGLEKNIKELLQPVLGNGKVTAKVTVDMDFDSTQKTVVTPDPNKVINSQKTIRETNGNGSGTTTNSSSTVDNNMSNTISTNGNGTSTKEENDTTYTVGNTEVKTITAPGEVKRITASVVVDGQMDAATTKAIQDLVQSAIGYKQDRGDQISVVGMAYNQAEKTQLQKEFDQIKLDEQNAAKTKMYMILGGIGVVLLGGIIFFIIKLKKKRDLEEALEEEEMEKQHLLDVTLNEKVQPEEVFEPINFETKNQKNHVEEEIKKYATEKPEQVADIIKSWLVENER
ncbi:flagellar basal-body MS-ring/collar protein FliF [Inconstantimicrobium mannanitabidum]|uniref:Flagellar M-ring protein n=1 Tax=Inconstantimicrobium mannanitabidum TaxID=1604901 RepID=A0ACB5R8Y2_9CLOT|nr:flagellar basal-body MS-ring/collar protein FliF [Clostridium sp. TW13]GKX65486.1 flagellar M-ring protein [Clostridium sp. TW13]